MYVLFWVFPRRLIKIAVCQRFGTLYQFHLQRLDVRYEIWLLRSGRGIYTGDEVYSSYKRSVFRRGRSRLNTLLLYLLPPHLLTHSDPPTTCCPLPIGPATSSKPRPLYKYHVRSSTTILHTSHPAFEDGTDRVLRNVSILQF